LKGNVYNPSPLKALQARNATLVLMKNRPAETESPRR